MSSNELPEPFRSSNQNEVFTYKAIWPTYAFSFTDCVGSFLIGSMLEQPQNYIQLLSYVHESNKIHLKACADHIYPATKIMWSPSPTIDLFATSSDSLRLWKYENNKLLNKTSLLQHSENKDYNGPLTSFDWSARDPSTLGTSSIDKTCTIWDLNKSAIKKQILAHNSEVNDIAFSNDSNIFVSASSDFSVRKFDLRTLEQCSIIYENNRQTAVVRVCWNKIDPNYLAILNMDSLSVFIMDIRAQLYPVNEIRGHQSGINTMCWSPSSYNLCTAGEDSHVLIREAFKPVAAQKDSLLVYNALEKVLGVAWSGFNEIGMTLSNSLQYIKL